MDAPCAEVLPFVSVYGTMEYLWTPESQRAGASPAPWTLRSAWSPKTLWPRKPLEGKGEKSRSFRSRRFITRSPACGGIWENGSASTWTPAVLAALPEHSVVIALVWLGHLAARLIFPGTFFCGWAFPRWSPSCRRPRFYSIQNDVLSPVCFGAAFIFLAKFLRAETPGIRLGSSPA